MKILESKNNVTILEDDGNTILISYKTEVAKINKDGLLWVTPCFYSRTTTKHINQFKKDYSYLIRG